MSFKCPVSQEELHDPAGIINGIQKESMNLCYNEGTRITIYAPLIYTAPCIMFWMRAYPLLGQVGGGWIL